MSIGITNIERCIYSNYYLGKKAVGINSENADINGDVKVIIVSANYIIHAFLKLAEHAIEKVEQHVRTVVITKK